MPTKVKTSPSNAAPRPRNTDCVRYGVPVDATAPDVEGGVDVEPDAGGGAEAGAPVDPDSGVGPTRTVAFASGEITVVDVRTSVPDARATLTMRPAAASAAVIVRGSAVQVADCPGAMGVVGQ